MTKTQFRNASEAMYADHLTMIGLTHQYEKQWGTHKPDFTITKDAAFTEVVAIADVKDLCYTPEDDAALAVGQMISICRNPALRTRRHIQGVWRQFEACSDYPCILVLASGGDTLPDAHSVMAAMLGDLTISVSTSMADDCLMKFTQFFGENGKMIDKDGKPMNTRLSAIGLLSSTYPDQMYSGFTDKVKEHGDQFLAEDTGEAAMRAYVNDCLHLKAELTDAGYDLDSSVTQVAYVVNPLAAKAFPKASLARGYVKVWERDLSNQTVALTYDWAKHPKPSLPIA